MFVPCAGISDKSAGYVECYTGPAQSPGTTRFTQIYCYKSCGREVPCCSIRELRCYGCTERIVRRRHYAQARFRETHEYTHVSSQPRQQPSYKQHGEIIHYTSYKGLSFIIQRCINVLCA
jgi:hypothetical protein